MRVLPIPVLSTPSPTSNQTSHLPTSPPKHLLNPTASLQPSSVISDHALHISELRSLLTELPPAASPPSNTVPTSSQTNLTVSLLKPSHGAPGWQTLHNPASAFSASLLQPHCTMHTSPRPLSPWAQPGTCPHLFQDVLSGLPSST